MLVDNDVEKHCHYYVIFITIQSFITKVVVYLV